MIKHLFLLSALLFCGLVGSVRAAEPAHLVIMIGEDEYHTWETLPEFAATDLKSKGYEVKVILEDPKDKNNFPGLTDALTKADLLMVSVRRRTPPKDQLDAIRAFLGAGKPLVGIRTACHAFALRPKDKLANDTLASWQDFDPEVLGGHYTNHHGPGTLTTVTIAPGAEKQSILQGLDVAKLIGNGSLYKVSPLEKGTTPLLIGTIPDKPAEPVAWTHRYGPKEARIFFTSLGHPDDFKNTEFRHLLLNSIAWALHP